MPFVKVFVFADTDFTILPDLRKDLVSTVTHKMGCKPSWVRPVFFRDLLPAPKSDEEGANTILVELGTGLFGGRTEDDLQVKSTLMAISDVIFSALGAVHEVEITVREWRKAWTYVREPK